MGKYQTNKQRFDALFDYVNKHDPWLLARWLQTAEGQGVVE